MTQAAGAERAIETAAAEGPPSTAARSSGSSFYTAMRVLPRPAARRDVRDLRLLPRGRRHRRWRRPASRRRAGLDAGGPISTRSMPASRRPASAGSPARPALRAGAGRFPRGHRRHGDGCRAGYPGPGFRRPRSLLRPRRQRGRPPFGQRSSASPRREGRDLAHELGRALQLTNILRDLDEDAAVGRLYLPREALDEPASPRSIRRRCWPIRRWTAPAPWSPRAPAGISPRPSAIIAPLPAPRRAGAPPHGRGLSRISSSA